jgi:dTDP-4-dehydro-6-deoxy-alpha-D-glucopyranose 2,3-dehydratase
MLRANAANICSRDLLESALVERDGRGNPLTAMDWFGERQRAHRFTIQAIPFSALERWAFDLSTGNLHHESGRFFTIEGVCVSTNWGGVPEWDQPIINQPEIGYLGFITRKIDGVLHFLVQAKMEPGNINYIQLAPTLQATRSNFTRVHQGKSPLYLDYFTDRSRSRVLVDSLQSEQGARFLRKRNRNIIIEVDEEIPVHDDFRWMTLGEIHRAMKTDNIVNMDARTVLSCVPYGACDRVSADISDFGRRLLQSLSPGAGSVHSNEEIISWFTEQKFRYELDIEKIPLNAVRRWERTETEIRHETGRYFSVIACSVEADTREVPSWTQPLVKAHQQGLISYIVKEIEGVLHFLLQAKVEPGNFDVVEMAPTVQCLTGSYEEAEENRRPPFTNYVLNARPEQVRFDALQSEEGGRFFREENRNLIVEADDEFPTEIPDNYIWMTAAQIKEFIKYNNFVNVQARCLLSSLSFC